MTASVSAMAVTAVRSRIVRISAGTVVVDHLPFDDGPTASRSIERLEQGAQCAPHSERVGGVLAMRVAVVVNRTLASSVRFHIT